MDYQVDEIQQKKRERIGLVVFVLSILAIFFAVFSYLTAGHSFDLTAQDIDSNVGQMDGYITLVFEGNNAPLPRQEQIQDKILRKASDFLGIQSVADSDSSSSSSESQISAEDDSINTEPATITNVSRFYREKFSTVTTIKPDAYNAYLQGEIFERNTWKIGLISVPQNILDAAVASDGKIAEIEALQKRIDKLRYVDEASLILVLCPNQKICDYLEKVDCAICGTTNPDVPESGKQCGSVYVMRIPTAGIVGTLTSSPAKMIIGRVYKEVETS